MQHRPITCLLTAIVISMCSAYAPRVGAACVNWPAQIQQQQLEALAGKQQVILVTDAVDQTKLPDDEWLSAGIRFYLSDLLGSSPSVAVLSPQLAAAAGAPSPQWRVASTFQHLPGKLRLFVAFSQSDGALLKQFAADIPYPDHKDFFAAPAKMAREMLQLMKASPSADNFSSLQAATASTGCYGAYARGRALLEQYTATAADASRQHFRDAKKIDFRSPLGYQGLIDANTFLGLYYKQEQKPFGAYFQEADAALSEMVRLARPAPFLPSIAKRPKPIDKKKLEVKLANSILQGQAAFTEGLHYAQQGNSAAALTALQQSVVASPLDARSWWELAKVARQTGNASLADQAQQRALSINSCLR